MVIGLTGNSGSGKSSVAAIMANEHGAYVIDADEIAHAVLLKNGSAYAEVIEAFGEGILDVAADIDRKHLGRLVFGNEPRRARLIEITHKHIIAEMLARLERARGLYPYVLMDAPLLIEGGLHKASDTVWLVYADRESRLARITSRDKITEAEARKRLDSQTSFDELKKYADVVLDNSGGIDALRAEVQRALERENNHGS